MNDVQKTILDIFKTVANICDRNNITYYAIGGTCIGAVRHHGFIPWDDDLDIAVPIEEWDLFWEKMEQELPEECAVYRCTEIKHFRYVFNKIHNVNTTFIENAERAYPDSYKGIFIDVMPIAGIPSKKNERKQFFRKINLLYKLNYIRRYPFIEMGGIKGRILWIIMQLFRPFISFHYFSDQWIRLLRKYPLRESQYTGYTWWYEDLEKLQFPVTYFNGTSKLDFEDTKICCPIDWNGYLTRQFGDYMELPSEDQRLDHHQVFVSTEKSYLEYKGDL